MSRTVTVADAGPSAETTSTASDLVPPRPRSRRNWNRVLARVGVVAALLIAWQLAAGTVIDTFYLPKLSEVVSDLSAWTRDGSLAHHIYVTVVPALEGFVIGSVIALVLGYLLASARFAGDVLEPFIATMYGIPVIALIPLMILWFGIGDALSVAVTAFATFFLMFYNAYFGIRDVSRTLIDQVALAGGSRLDIMLRVRLPSALVWLLAGMKIAVPHSLVGVVVVEFLTGSEGLGYLLSFNASQFNAAGTFAAVFVLAAISFLLDRIVFVLTKPALIWKTASHHG